MKKINCCICQDEKWVCEKHNYLAWDLECSCGAGIPCICNPCGYYNPPQMPPGFKEHE